MYIYKIILYIYIYIYELNILKNIHFRFLSIYIVCLKIGSKCTSLIILCLLAFYIFIIYILYIFCYIYIIYMQMYIYIYILLCIYIFLKFYYIYSHKWSTTHIAQSAQISQKQDGRNIYSIMKTMCSPGYHHNGFVATHALAHVNVFMIK